MAGLLGGKTAELPKDWTSVCSAFLLEERRDGPIFDSGKEVRISGRASGSLWSDPVAAMKENK